MKRGGGTSMRRARFEMSIYKIFLIMSYKLFPCLPKFYFLRFSNQYLSDMTQ